jgi:hypothetical protein
VRPALLEKVKEKSPLLNSREAGTGTKSLLSGEMRMVVEGSMVVRLFAVP